jgi:peptidoglycan/LPS O-acetylase OafA/YrhL
MRLKQLDGIRGLAAAQVMFSHVLGATGAAAYVPLINTAVSGASAVILFFVLSGLVLSLPYYNGRKMHLSEFYVRRVFRIYPAFLISLGVAFLALALFPDVVSVSYSPKQWGTFGIGAPWGGWTVTNILRYAALIYPFTDYRTVLHHGAVWSLIVEMRISIILPAIILIVAWLRSPRLAIAILTLLLALQIVKPDFPPSWMVVIGNQIFWITIFLVGVVASRHLNVITESMSRWHDLGHMALIAGCLAVYLAAPFLFTEEADYYRFSVVVALASLGMMLAALASHRLDAMLSSRVPQFLGYISYSLYLYSLMKAVLLPIMGLGPALAIYVCATVGAAYLSARFIEAPMIRLGAILGAQTRARALAFSGSTR